MFLIAALSDRSDYAFKNENINLHSLWRNLVGLNTSLKNTRTQLSLALNFLKWPSLSFETVNSDFVNLYCALRKSIGKCIAFVCVT